MRSPYLVATAGLVVNSLISSLAQGRTTPVADSHWVLATTDFTPSGPLISARDTSSTFTVVNGHVRSPTGPLPGAVVTVQGYPQHVVTNANGEFRLDLPAATAPLRLTASYAGFTDESVTLLTANQPVTVDLLHRQTIKVSRKQRLKVYIKTARRQVKRSLRRL